MQQENLTWVMASQRKPQLVVEEGSAKLQKAIPLVAKFGSGPSVSMSRSGSLDFFRAYQREMHGAGVSLSGTTHFLQSSAPLREAC